MSYKKDNNRRAAISVRRLFYTSDGQELAEPAKQGDNRHSGEHIGYLQLCDAQHVEAEADDHKAACAADLSDDGSI